MLLVPLVASLVLYCSVCGFGQPPAILLQSGATPQNVQGSQTAAPEKPSPGQPKASSNACSEQQSGSAAKSNCKTAAAGKSQTNKQSQKHAKSSENTPSKTVVRNGGTGEPDVAISSGQSPQQAARLKEMHRLLAAADLNLKDVAVRGLSASQQVTIKQIRSYMEEAKAAESNGDVERAYTLANKANMLAVDLNGH